jgi:hypothetical protein
MHVAGLLDRRGFARAADALRRFIPAARIERGVSSLLRAPFRLIVTEAGGSALDIDTEEDFEIAKLRFESWWKSQRERAIRVHGSPSLPGSTGRPADPAA